MHPPARRRVAARPQTLFGSLSSVCGNHSPHSLEKGVSLLYTMHRLAWRAPNPSLLPSLMLAHSPDVPRQFYRGMSSLDLLAARRLMVTCLPAVPRRRYRGRLFLDLGLHLSWVVSFFVGSVVSSSSSNRER